MMALAVADQRLKQGTCGVHLFDRRGDKLRRRLRSARVTVVSLRRVARPLMGRSGGRACASVARVRSGDESSAVSQSSTGTGQVAMRLEQVADKGVMR